MPSYVVSWTVDVEAHDEQAAAVKARGMQLNPRSTATVYDVRDRVGEPATIIDIDARLLEAFGSQMGARDAIKQFAREMTKNELVVAINYLLDRLVE